MGAAEELEELDLEELGLEILPEEVELDREIAGRGLLAFLRCAWERVEKDPLVVGWHNELVCDVLEAVSRGEIRDFVINQPPGTTKSLSAAVMWPIWDWIHINGAHRWIFATYSDALTKRDALRTKSLVDSPWFRARWPDVRFPQTASRSLTRLENAMGGVRFSTSIKGGVTGEHAHRIMVDDPIKPMETLGSRAALGTELEAVRSWWDNTLSTRQADPKRTAKGVIMQRLHMKDLAQKVIDEVDGIVHVNLPMRFEPKAACFIRWEREELDEDGETVTVEVVREDPRTEPGELLCPGRYPEEEVRKLEKNLGSRGTAAQLQQRPNPEGGLTFEKQWFRYWGRSGQKYVELPARRREIQIWDMSFKGKAKPGQKRSFVCGMAWAHIGADMLLLGMEHGQWGFVQQQKAVERLTGSFPRTHRKYIEDAANGPAIVDEMKGKISGLKLVPTGGGSEARAEAASIHFESGNVYFPDKSTAPWVETVEKELLAFPMGRHDDIVDCVSHAVVLMAGKSNESYRKAMKNIAKAGGMVA